MIDHLRHALRYQSNAMVGTLWITDAGKQQPQVIMYFSHGADSGTGVL
jgi:hypothetical protein